MSYWTAVVTHPQAEDKARENVVRQGYGVYLPKSDVRSPGARHPRVRPLFPRYLFVQIIDAWYSLQSTLGCIGPIMSGRNPYTDEALPGHVPDVVIEKLRGREEGGLVRLPFDFHVGQSVLVTQHNHIFNGHTVIFQGMAARARAMIMLSFLGSERAVEIPVCYLEAV